jgi:hypothetical protein
MTIPFLYDHSILDRVAERSFRSDTETVLLHWLIDHTQFLDRTHQIELFDLLLRQSGFDPLLYRACRKRVDIHVCTPVEQTLDRVIAMSRYLKRVERQMNSVMFLLGEKATPPNQKESALILRILRAISLNVFKIVRRCQGQSPNSLLSEALYYLDMGDVPEAYEKWVLAASEEQGSLEWFACRELIALEARKQARLGVQIQQERDPLLIGELDELYFGQVRSIFKKLSQQV